MSLLAANQAKKHSAMTGAESLAGMQKQRDANNEVIEDQYEQQRASGVGTGVAMGLMIGGPVGWVVGGAMVLSALF